jgi:hypothetical protein
LEFMKVFSAFMMSYEYYGSSKKKNTMEMLNGQRELLSNISAKSVLLNTVLIKTVFELEVLNNQLDLSIATNNRIFRELVDILIFSENFKYASYYLDELEKLFYDKKNIFWEKLVLKRILLMVYKDDILTAIKYLDENENYNKRDYITYKLLFLPAVGEYAKAEMLIKELKKYRNTKKMIGTAEMYIDIYRGLENKNYAKIRETYSALNKMHKKNEKEIMSTIPFLMFERVTKKIEMANDDQ